MLYEDLAPNEVDPPQSAIEAIIEISREYGDWLRWASSERGFPGPPVPLFGLESTLARLKDVPKGKFEEFTKLMRQIPMKTG